jgi:CXXX repeat modification system protein
MKKMNINNRKSVGKVTKQERDEIKTLFERRNGLTELFKAVTEENSYLYDRIVNDMGQTTTQFQKWWDEKSIKYNWENIKGFSWEIDFETYDIFLVKK